jgi:hypothetical protein
MGSLESIKLKILGDPNGWMERSSEGNYKTESRERVEKHKSECLWEDKKWRRLYYKIIQMVEMSVNEMS